MLLLFLQLHLITFICIRDSRVQFFHKNNNNDNNDMTSPL